jgi:hypothetical protein
MVIDEGKCQLIAEAKGNECVQEPLPDAIRVLLCLIDGAERRQSLLRRWSVTLLWWGLHLPTAKKGGPKPTGWTATVKEKPNSLGRGVGL